MSLRGQFAARLRDLDDTFDIEYEGVAFTPETDAPYMKAFMLMGKTSDLCVSEDKHLKSGIFQVTLMYPTGSGMKDIEDKALAIVNLFSNGLVMNDIDDGKISIIKTPQQTNGGVIGDRLSHIISIYYKLEK